MEITRKRIAWTIGIITGLLLLGILFVRLFAPVSGNPTSHSVSGVIDMSQGGEALAYRVVGEYEGKLAIFLPGAETPETVYEVRIAGLPKDEQERLKAGIEAADEVALASLIEDYTG